MSIWETCCIYKNIEVKESKTCKDGVYDIVTC